MSLIFNNCQVKLTSSLSQQIINNGITNIKRNINLTPKKDSIKLNLPSINLNNEKKLFTSTNRISSKRFNSTSKDKGTY